MSSTNDTGLVWLKNFEGALAAVAIVLPFIAAFFAPEPYLFSD
jgi:hypothetical protein